MALAQEEDGGRQPKLIPWRQSEICDVQLYLPMFKLADHEEMHKLPQGQSEK